MAKQADIELVVGIREEGRLAPVAALRHVMRNSGEDQASGARHRPMMHGKRKKGNSFHAKHGNETVTSLSH